MPILEDIYNRLHYDGAVKRSYEEFKKDFEAQGERGYKFRNGVFRTIKDMQKEGFSDYDALAPEGTYEEWWRARSAGYRQQKQREQMKNKARENSPVPRQPKPSATPQGQKPKPVQQPTPNKPDSVAQQYMPTYPDPTATTGQSKVRPQQGTGVLKRDSQIMDDDSLSAADKVALINENRRRRGQSERNFNDYQEAARDAGVNSPNPVEGFTESVEAGFQPDHFFTDSEGNVLDYKPDNYVNKSPVTQYNDRIKEIADEINYYNTKQDQGGGGTTRIEDAINAANAEFEKAYTEDFNRRKEDLPWWSRIGAQLTGATYAGAADEAIRRGRMREDYAGIKAVADAAYNAFPDAVKQKYGEDTVRDAIYQATFAALQENATPKNFGAYLGQKLTQMVPGILYKSAVRAGNGGVATLEDIADAGAARYEEDVLDKNGAVGFAGKMLGEALPMVADPTFYIPFGGAGSELVSRGIAKVATKRAIAKGLESGAVKTAGQAALQRVAARGAIGSANTFTQMLAYNEAVGLAQMANGSGQNFWDMTGESIVGAAKMAPIGFIGPVSRVVKGRVANAITDMGLSRGGQWAANTAAKLGLSTGSFIAEAGVFAAPDLIGLAVNGTYTNEQAEEVMLHSLGTLAAFKATGMFNPMHIEQTRAMVQSMVKGTMGTELALNRHDSEALERLGYPKIQGDNIMSLFIPLADRPEAKNGGGYFSQYSQIVLDERVPWSTRAKLMYIATGMLPETGMRPNQVRITTDENGRTVVTTLQGNNPISQRFFSAKHKASAESYYRKASHDVERMNFEGAKQDIYNEFAAGMVRSKLVDDALKKKPQDRTEEEQQLVDEFNATVENANDIIEGARVRVKYLEKLPDPEEALKKPVSERTEEENRAVERYGTELNARLDELRKGNIAFSARADARAEAELVVALMSNSRDGKLYQCGLRGENGELYTVVDFDGTIGRSGDGIGMSVVPGRNGDKMLVRNMRTGEKKFVTTADLEWVSLDKSEEVRSTLTENSFRQKLDNYTWAKRRASYYGRQPRNAEVGERMTLAKDKPDPNTGYRPEYTIVDKDAKSGTYVVEDEQGNRRMINGHDILQKVSDEMPQLPERIAPQAPPQGPQTPPPAAPQGQQPPTQQPPAQEPPQGEAPAMPEQGDVFKLKVGDEFKDAEVIGKDDTGIIVRYEDNGTFRTEHLTPEELAPRMAPSRPVVPNIDPKDMTNEAIARELQILEDYDHHPATTDFDGDLVLRRDLLLEELARRQSAPVTPPAQGEGEGGAPAAPENGIPEDENGNKLFHKAEPKAVEDYLKNEKGYDDRFIAAIADKRIAEAQKDLADAAAKREKAYADVDEQAMDEAIAAERDAQERLDWWNKFKEGYGKEEQPAGEQPPVVEGGGEPDIPHSEPMPARKSVPVAPARQEPTTPEEKAAAHAENVQRWNNAPKIYGHTVVITLPNGEMHRARYVLSTHDAATASHDALHGYMSTPGYPEDNGRNANDRDYTDKDNQVTTERIANDFNGLAFQNPPIVNTGSEAGHLLGGNGTKQAHDISITLGAEGKDGKYLDVTDENIPTTGISRRAFRDFLQNVDGHPMVYLELVDEVPHDTATMKKFNDETMKSNNSAQSTLKIARLLTDSEIVDLDKALNLMKGDDLEDLMGKPTVASAVLKVLVDGGYIGQNQVAQYTEGNGTLSARGIELVRELIRGTILDERAIKALNMSTDKYSLADVKRRIDQLAVQLVHNASLGDFSLKNEISRAVEFIQQAYSAWNGKGSREAALRAALKLDGGDIDFEGMTEDEIASERIARILSQVLTSFRHNKDYKVQTSLKIDDAVAFFEEYERNVQKAMKDAKSPSDLWGKKETREDVLKFLLTLKKYKDLFLQKDNGPEQPEQGQGQPGETETPGGNGGGNQGNGRPSGTSGTGGEGGTGTGRGTGEGRPAEGEGPVTPPKPGAPQGGGEPPKGEGEPPKPEEPGKPAGEPAGGPAASEPHQLTVDEVNSLDLPQRTKDNAIAYINGDTESLKTRNAYQRALREWERVNGKSGEGKPETPPTTPEDNGPQEPPKGGGGTTGRGGGKPSTPKGGGKPSEPKPAEPKPEGEGPKNNGGLDLSGLDRLGEFEGVFSKKKNESRRPTREGEIVNEARFVPETATDEQVEAFETAVEVLAGIGKQLVDIGMRTQSELVDFMRGEDKIRTRLEKIGFDEEDMSTLFREMWTEKVSTTKGDMRLSEYADELSKADKPKQDDKPKQIVSPVAPTVKNVVYKPKSKGKTNESIIPASMAQAVSKALGKINGGDTDGFVMDKVGFKDKDELYEALNAEQIDGVALAISAIERGEGLILGDMTGIGKGRQLAAVMRYARKEGIRPVFVTEKPGLFKDMMRDLLDVGADTPNKPFRPLIIASADNGDVTLSDGSTVKAADAKTIEKLLSGDLDKLAKDYDALFVTYANTNNVAPDAFFADQNAVKKEKTHNEKTETKEPPELTKKKLNLIAKWARGSIVVMDEAHNAAGTDSNQAVQWREIIDTTSGVGAKGVVMASATYAKTPKNYVLYALRTPIKEAHLSNSQLLATFTKGGVPLQEWLASQLTGESYIRRERDMTGVNFDYRICVDGYDAEHPENSTPEAIEKVKAIRKSNDKAANIANIMLALDNKASDAFKKIKEVLVPGKGQKGGSVSVLVQQADGTYKEETINAANYPEPLKMTNSTFSAKIAAVNAQLFMAEKAESAADAAIKAIENGEMPMIVFENTFDALMKDLPVDENGVLKSADYAQAFVRYLEQLGNFTIKLPKKNANGAQEILKCRINLSGDPDFALAKRMIETEGVGLHVSPVDRIRERLEEAGYKVGELSGREFSIQKLPDGKYHKVKRKTENPDKVTDDYNTGKIDVLLINGSGSTGRSMHEKGTLAPNGEKIPGTTQSGEPMMMKPRHQIYVQNFNNETTMVQAMGRIDRTGQVEHGRYTFLMTPVPAETNILMRAQRKREQLKANTTAQQDRNSFDAVNASDFINKYGDQVVAEYLENNPKIANALQIPLKVVRDGTGKATPGLAKKATANAYTLTCDQQQEFYDDVQAAYDEYVKVLKENGDYDLETQVVDLQAETLAEHMFVRGSHESDSMFSQDTSISRCRVKVQRKPMKVEEIEQHIKEVTGAEDSYEYEDKFQEKFDKHFADMEAEVEKEFEAKEKNVDNDDKKNDKLGKIRAFKAEAQRLVKDFPLDLLMPFYADTSEVNDAQGRITTESMPHAIVYDVKLGRTLGSSTIVFAVNDGRQKVAVRMNDDATFRYLRRLQIMPAGDFERSEWNKSQGDAYEDAFIITGNLIGAYHSPIAQRGRMIRYTDSEGNQHTGILMPRNFKTKDVQVEKPISEFFNQLMQFARFRSTSKDTLPVFAGGQLEVNNTRYNNEFYFTAKGELAKRIDGDPELEIYRTGKTTHSYKVYNYQKGDNSIQKVLSILAGRYGVSASVPIDPAYFMTREERDAEAEARMFRVEPNIEERENYIFFPGRRGKAYIVHVPKERRKNVDASGDWFDKVIHELNGKGFYGDTDKLTTNESGKRVFKEIAFQNKAMAEEFVRMVNEEPVRPLAIDEKAESAEPNWEEVDRSEHTYRFAAPEAQLTGDDIAKDFGFRGVDTGNTSAEGVRDLHNAFMTMAMILNIDPRSLSLGGNMDVNMLGPDAASREFGPGVTAHFKVSGETSSYTGRTQKKMQFRAGESAFPLAHEWFHALDNYFGTFGLKNEETGFYEQTRHATENADKEGRPWTAREEMREAFNGILRSLVESGFYGRLENEHFFKGTNFTDSSNRPKYWGKRTEMLARAFEAYMRKKIAENEDNLRIAGMDRMLDMVSDGRDITSGEFDPTPEEQAVIDKAFDKFFETIKERRDPNTGRFNMYEQAKPGETKREATMRETRNLNRVLAKTGLANSVVIESETEINKAVWTNRGIPLREISGRVYGYTDEEGNVHLNAAALNFETPIHEYGHLWNAWAKKNHGDLWQRGIELAKESDAFKVLKKQAEDKGSVYHGMTDDQLADEVLADAIGKKGQSMYDPKDWTRTARVKNWFTQLWHRIGEALGFRKRLPDMAVGDMSFDDIIRTAAGDILSGKRMKGAEGRRNGAAFQSRNKGETRILGNGTESYTETREDGTLDRKILRGSDGTTYATWFDSEGRKKDEILYYPNGEVKAVRNYDSEGAVTRELYYDENRQLTRHWEPRIGTDWKRGEDGAARGTSNGVEIRPYNFRFQQAPANNPAGSTQGNNEQLHIAREYAQDRTRTTTKLYEEVVENSVSLRHVLEDIARKSGKPIADYENVYLAENQSHGMMTTELITFRDRRVQPLLDQLRKLAKNYGGEPAKNYVWARHGIERSIYVCFCERAYELAEKEAEAAARARGEEVTQQDINDAYNAMLDELYNATSGYSRRAYLENLETDCSNILSAHGDTEPFEVTDKAGLTALNDKRSLVDDKPIENAWEIVKEYENNAGTEGESDVEALFDRLNDISKSMLDYSRDKGMMDKDTVEKIRKMFRFYVPLQGFAEGTMAQDYFEYVDSNPMRAGRSVPNTPKMRGRTSESADPIATLVRNAEMTIAAARRNTVATHLYNLATSRDTDLFAPARAWEAYDAAEDTWVPSTPDFTGCETTKDMMDAIRLHDEQMRQQRELGLAREARRGFSNRLITAQGAPKGLKMSMRQRHEHAVPVRINGKENVIYVLSDPRIAQIVNGTDKGSVDKEHSKFFYQANRLKRIQSALFTSYNFAFWFANGFRDIQSAALRQAIMESGSAAARTAWQGVKGDPLGIVPWEAYRLYNKAVKGNLDESDKHERYFKEFFEHGGITGYAFADQAETIQNRVRKLLKNPKRGMRRLMFAVGEFMEKSGGAFEIAPRFATYVASRDGGKSIMQSVADAKETTVNFDRRGARRTWTMRFLASFYAFLNPGIQGMQNRLHQVRTHPGKTSVLHAMDFAMGYVWKGVAVALLAALGRKDDEYDTQLTDHDRRNNVCIPFGDDDWIKLPINMEDRVIWGLGDAVRNKADFFEGNRYIGGKEKSEYDDDEGWWEYAKLISAWFPIDVGSENNFVMTSAQPWYDVYVNRKDWRGDAVDWRNEDNAQKPEYMRSNKYRTGKLWMEASKWWSEQGGGDEKRRADDEWHEINPQHMQYIVQSYLGGLGTTIGQVMSLAETAFSDDDDVKWNSFKFPIVNRFWKGNFSEYSSTKDERKKQRIWQDWAEEIIRRDREYRKDGADKEGSENTLSERAMEHYEENLRYLELAKEVDKLARKKSTAKSKATKKGEKLTKEEEQEFDNNFRESIPDFEEKFMEIDGKRRVPKWRKHHDY